MDKLLAGSNYLQYVIKAKTAHGIHSPFVFDLFNNVIKNEIPFYGFDLIESLRARHLLDLREIEVNDLGAKPGIRKRTISEIAKRSVKPKKYAQLLFRLVNYFQPENILEIGTSLGITTLYLSLPKRNNQIITLEGCPNTADLAKKNFNTLKRSNIELICGEFDSTLPVALSKIKTPGLIFFDGNHRGKATLSYFENCLKHANDDSVFIFDDIHWSKEMIAAWKEIKSNPAVTISIDLFQFGIIFFRKGVVKQHFTLLF